MATSPIGRHASPPTSPRSPDAGRDGRSLLSVLRHGVDDDAAVPLPARFEPPAGQALATRTLARSNLPVATPPRSPSTFASLKRKAPEPGDSPGQQAEGPAAAGPSGAFPIPARWGTRTTADELVQILEWRLQSRSVASIAKQIERPARTVQRWIEGPNWKANKLLAAVTKLEGYARLRERIQESACKLHLHEGELPLVPEEPDASRAGAAEVAATSSPMSARVIGDALEMKLAYPTLTNNEIARRMGRTDVVRWLGGASAWEKKTLAKILAGYDGYAQERERLQHCVRALHVHEGELPPPQQRRVENTAAALAATLELIIELKGSKTPLLGPLAERLGGREAHAMMQLVRADGGLKGKIGNAMRLAGFEAERPRIVDALTALGHHDEAAKLQVDAPRRRTATAGLLVEVLNDIASHPPEARGALDIRTLAHKHAVAPGELPKLMTGSGVLRAKPQTLAALPGYDEHAQALRAALRALGHDEAARSLEPAGEGGSAPAMPRRASACATPDDSGTPGVSHRRMTARDVCEALDLKRRSVPTAEIAARLRRPLSTLQRYLAASWSTKLGETLAGFNDYADFRERIQIRLRELNMLDDDLPPVPERSRTWHSAATLAATLEFIAERPAGPMPGQFFKVLAHELGPAAKGMERLVTTRGKPIVQKNALMRLSGFAQERQRIVAALDRLGHHEHANELQDEAVGRPGTVTAGILVEVLRDIASHPSSERSSVKRSVLARTHDVRRLNLDKLIGPGGALRVAPRKLADLAGYDEHAGALRKALRSLGQDEAAHALKPAAVNGRAFLNVVWQDFEALMDLASRMAADPSLDRTGQAEIADVHPDVVKVLIDKRGAVRTAAALDERLRGLDDAQRASAADFRARFAAHYAGEPQERPPRPHPSARPSERPLLPHRDALAAPLAGAGAALLRVELESGRFGGDKLLLVHPASVDPGAKAPRRLERLYGRNVPLVREPRSYEGHRPRQVLRWLATVLRHRLPRTVEVQCYYDEHTRRITVTGNTQNRELRLFIAEGGLQRLLRDPAHMPITTGMQRPRESEPATPRQQRHHDKLARRWRDEAGRDGPSAAIFDAILANRIDVPNKKPSFDPTRTNTHAERRILESHREKYGKDAALDTDRLAGVMRPCGTCASVLDLPADASRGPYWLTHGGRQDVDIEALIAHDQHHGIGTSVTRTREGALTFKVDTDSDSDADAPRLGTPTGT